MSALVGRERCEARRGDLPQVDVRVGQAALVEVFHQEEAEVEARSKDHDHLALLFTGHNLGLKLEKIPRFSLITPVIQREGARLRLGRHSWSRRRILTAGQVIRRTRYHPLGTKYE